jgi:hypothetical protein
MVLPITIDSTAFFDPPHGGPFKSGTSFYVVATTDTNGEIRVYKADSDDPSSGWTAQDISNEPTNASANIQSLHSVLDGTTIHIVTQEFSGAGTDVRYNTFDCSTNTWGTTDEVVTSTPDASIGFCSVAVRSDGDVITAYQGAVETNMGTGYDRIDIARRESGSWTADISVDNLGKTTTHMRYPYVVMSANDRAHIFYHDDTSDDLFYSTYLSGNTWGHQHTSIDSTASSSTAPANSVRAVRFDDGGTEKIRAVYDDSASGNAVVGFDDADSPGGSISIATNINTSDGTDSFAFAVDDGTDTQHFLYNPTATATELRHAETGSGDDTWATDTQEIGSLTSADVFSANVYDNGGTVLAYLYLDGVNYRYNERTLSAGTVYQGTGTAALTVDSTAAATRTVGAATGTAAITIDATADATRSTPGAATAAFDIDATADGVVTQAGSGTAAFDVDASAAATRTRAATATAALEIDATADATRSVGAASGTAAFDVDMAANATRAVGAASGTASFDVDMSAAASAAQAASATAAFDVDATAAATRTVGAATGTMSFDIDVTADATRLVGAATGTMSLEVDIAADGFRFLKGDATAAFDIDVVADATVSGGTVFEGTGTAAFEIDASADGTRSVFADAIAAFDIDAAADATRTVGAATGTAAFDVDASADATRLVGAAAGTMAIDVDMSAAASAAKVATATASFDIDASAAATREVGAATATASLEVDASANATRTVGAATGTMAFDVDIAADATRSTPGAATMAFDVDATAGGTKSVFGSATASFDVDATGAATRTVGDASATAAITVDLSADATRSVFGSATAAFDIDVVADATIEAPGTVFDGTATAAFDVDMTASPAASLFALASSEINIDMTAVATGGSVGERAPRGIGGWVADQEAADRARDKFDETQRRRERELREIIERAVLGEREEHPKVAAKPLSKTAQKRVVKQARIDVDMTGLEISLADIEALVADLAWLEIRARYDRRKRDEEAIAILLMAA